MRIIMAFILFFTLIAGVNAEINGFNIEKFNIELEKPIKEDRTPLISGNEEIAGYLNTNMRMRVFKYQYFSYKIESIFTTHQFRHVGLHLESGFDAFGINIYVRHYSGHSLDFRKHDMYPESNTVGIRLNFIGE